MLLLIVVSLAVVTIIQSAVGFSFTPLEYNSTADWSLARHVYRFPPLVVRTNGGLLVHVLDSDDPEHAIHVYSAEYGLCRVPLKLHFQQRYPRRATTLGNGKIVVWLLDYRLTRRGHRVSLHEGKWRFAIVEPRSCASAPDILAIKDSELEFKPVDVVDVVGYHDYFEVFVYPLAHNAQSNVYGFRYHDNEVPIKKPSVNSVVPDNSGYRPNCVRIHTVLSHSSSSGYFYLRASNDLTIERLAPDFHSKSKWTASRLEESRCFDDDGDSYSVARGVLTYCRRARHRRQLHCSFLDAELRSRMNVSLDYAERIDYFGRIGRSSVSNTADGGALLAVAVDANHRLGPPVYLRKIRADGRAGEAWAIGRFYCEVRRLHGFEMSDGRHCVCVVCDEVVHTRCFRLQDETDVTM